MPLSQFQKNRLKAILRQMAADGESEANMDARIKDFVDEAETIRAQHETRLAEERAVQPALVSPLPPMAGAVSPWGIANPKADWSQFAPGVVEGMVKDFPEGLYNLFAHPIESVKGIPHILDPLAGTPRDVGRFAGATAAPAALGLGASKAVGAVGRFAAPEATLTKVKGMIHNAYNGLLKTGTPEAPSSLDYAMPYILEEAKGKPFIDLHHFKTLVDSASDNFSSMMRGLEDQFRGIPLNLAHVKDAIMKEIPSITSTSMGKSIAKWAFETFDKVSDLGDFLQKRAELNEKLRTFERKNKVAQRDVMGNPKAAADVNAVNKIRDIIDNTIDAHAGGNINARAMYQLESALKDVKEAGPEAVQANENLKAGVAGRRLGSLPSQEAVGLAASVPRSPYAIYRGTMGVTKQLTSKFNMPDALMQKAGQLLQEGGLVRQPGKLAVQAPMQWWQNPPVNPPGASPPPSGVQGVSPGVPGAMPPAVRQPMVGQVVEPGGTPPNAPVNPPAQIGPTAMPNLVQVGPGKWVAQDVLEAGRPPGEVGPGRVFNLPPYSPTTASDMEFNQSIINRPTRKVGKPPKSTWRMKKDLRPVEPQPGELDVRTTQEPVETKPFEVKDLRPDYAPPEVNPLAPERMQEAPLVRDELVRPPEGPTKKVGKPPRPLKVSDTRTVKPKEGELEVKSSPINFDQVEGLGAVPWNQDVDYRGFTRDMSPDEFLRTAAPSFKGPEYTNSMVEHIKKTGASLGSPFLDVKWNKETGTWDTIGHEGRTRSAAVKQIAPETKMPVHIFPEGMRARDLTPEMRAARISPEKSSGPEQLIEGFHGTRTDISQASDFGGAHIGTEKAAQQRLENTPSGRTGGIPGSEKIQHVQARIRKPYGTQENPISEQELFEITNLPGRLDALKSKGHDSIIYRNDVEDPGSISTLIFDPSKIARKAVVEPTVTNAPRQPGLDADVYNVSWPGTDKQSTMYAKPGESIDDVVSRFKSKFPRE